MWCIISNNCYGLNYYKKNKYEYNTPFVGLFLYSPDYIRLLENFEHYMAIEPVPLPNSRSKYNPSSKYPIGIIDNAIEIHFLHDTSIDIALEKWNRRKARMPTQMNHYLFKLCDRDQFNEEIGLRFCQLPFQHKVMFISQCYHKHFMSNTSTRIIEIPMKETPTGDLLERMVDLDKICGAPEELV
jgi:uncharacterized protein (DUF1919 family)